MNAHAERFVRSIKHECLNRIVPLGENHLRTTVRAYLTHYHLERNHQGLDNRLIFEAADSPGNEGSIRCRELPNPIMMDFAFVRVLAHYEVRTTSVAVTSVARGSR